MSHDLRTRRRVKWRGGEFTGPVEIHAPEPRALPTVRLHGISLHAVTEEQCVHHILDELDADRGGWVATHNLDHLRRLRADPDFAALCADANLRVADGMPLIWAANLQGTPLPERVAGSNLVWSLSAAAATRGRSIFLLGGDPGTAEAAASVFRTDYPTLTVAGACCPPVGFEDDVNEMNHLVNALTETQPDIVFVALGSPKQERLIVLLRERLPRTWWLGVGISFSFVCGAVKRAPVWMQGVGLEWVHRLAQEPRRLARRYLVDGMPFACRLLARSALQRAHAAGSR